MDVFLSKLTRFGIGLAAVGGVVNSALYNGKYNFFFSIFILWTHRKAIEVLIHRVSNYPNLLLEMSRYCCLLEI